MVEPSSTTTAGALLIRFGELIARHEWAGLRALLADDAEVHYIHTGERFEPDAFVALVRDYPGDWKYHVDEVIDAGTRAVLHSHTVIGDQVTHCTTIATLHDGQLTDVSEIWAEPTAPHPSRQEHDMTTPLHVDYVEIGVTDMSAARAFYADAFGWEFTDYGPGYSGIRSADGQGEVGGLNGDREPGTAGPLLLIKTSDLDASHAEVRGAGGQVVDAPYNYPGGRRFTFRDPSGNVLGVYEPAG